MVRRAGGKDVTRHKKGKQNVRHGRATSITKILADIPNSEEKSLFKSRAGLGESRQSGVCRTSLPDTLSVCLESQGGIYGLVKI